jgi:hypothetical protein
MHENCQVLGFSPFLHCVFPTNKNSAIPYNKNKTKRMTEKRERERERDVCRLTLDLLLSLLYN